jgi:hypothetical protein
MTRTILAALAAAAILSGCAGEPSDDETAGWAVDVCEAIGPFLGAVAGTDNPAVLMFHAERARDALEEVDPPGGLGSLHGAYQRWADSYVEALTEASDARNAGTRESDVLTAFAIKDARIREQLDDAGNSAPEQVAEALRFACRA